MGITDLGDLGAFIESLADIQIKDVKFRQDIKIPNWPKAAGDLKIKLGKRNCFYPIEAKETGMLRLVTRRRRLDFLIKESGAFGFVIGTFDKDYFGTDSGYLMSRVRGLMLFHQFKGEILPRVIQKLKIDLGDHNKVVEMFEKAIEPFVPFIVADQLSS